MNANSELSVIDKEIFHKEIDLVQGVISKIAEEQRKIKEVSITILGGLFGLFSLTKGNPHILAAVMGASIICILGFRKIYYNLLKTEKLYCTWYDFLVDNRNSNRVWAYELNPDRINKILENQTFKTERHIKKSIAEKTKKSWSLSFYNTLLITMIILYLPACFAVLSTHFNIFPAIK